MLALVYDVHGNLPALEAVLADAEATGADRWLLGGGAAWTDIFANRIVNARLWARVARPCAAPPPRS